jgi:hypothetical protein
MHWIALLAAALLVISGYAVTFVALNQRLPLQEQINAKLPASRRFEPLFWWLERGSNFASLNRRHYRTAIG